MDFIHLKYGFIFTHHYCITNQKASVILFHGVHNADNIVLFLDDDCNKKTFAHQDAEYKNMFYYSYNKRQLCVLLLKLCLLCLPVYVIIIFLVTTILCDITMIQDFGTDSF